MPAPLKLKPETATLQTRCPHCQTLFEILEAQLRAASGQVRCSYCDNIFNARKHLIPTEPKSGSTQEALQPDNKGGAVSLNELFGNIDPEQADFSDLYTGTPPTESEGNLSLNTSSEKPEESKSHKPNLHSGNSENAGESLTRGEKLTFAVNLEKHDFDSAIPESVTSESVEAPIPPIRRQIAESEIQTGHLSIPESLLQSDRTSRNKSAGQPLLWSLVILCLLATALAQTVWFSRARLHNYPEVRELLEYVCVQAGCSLPPWREPEQFNISSRTVRTHPDSNKALQILLVFHNAARFAQPYPQLQLRLYDTNEELSAQRVFRPDEYLADPQLRASLIEPAQSVAVEMALEDPGVGITGFKIEFL